MSILSMRIGPGTQIAFCFKGLSYSVLTTKLNFLYIPCLIVLVTSIDVVVYYKLHCLAD
jgi:hypothetical protein